MKKPTTFIVEHVTGGGYGRQLAGVFTSLPGAFNTVIKYVQENYPRKEMYVELKEDWANIHVEGDCYNKFKISKVPLDKMRWVS